MGTKDGKGIKILAAIGLIITTIIWGSAFVVMKNSVDIISPTYLLALRFTIAAIALILVFWRKVMKINKSDLFCGGLLGVFLFVSYFFQTYGLKYTTASKNAFITTLYVILVPFFTGFLTTRNRREIILSPPVSRLWALRCCRWKGIYPSTSEIY